MMDRDPRAGQITATFYPRNRRAAALFCGHFLHEGVNPEKQPKQAKRRD